MIWSCHFSYFCLENCEIELPISIAVFVPSHRRINRKHVAAGFCIFMLTQIYVSKDMELVQLSCFCLYTRVIMVAYWKYIALS